MTAVRLSAVKEALNKDNLLALAERFVYRCKRDKVNVSAGHLAYVTLLSLVPFIMVFFTILSAFPAFSAAREKLEAFIFTNFVPTASDTVQKYIGGFVSNASEMGSIGIITLLIIALLLISNVDKTLNSIWRTKRNRPAVYTFAIYWMVISLGPLLMGSSVAVSSYLTGLASFAETYTPGLGTFLLKLVPVFTAMAAFVILYTVVPNKPVKPRYAIFGALVATMMFELSKKGFALYVTNFPSYERIYGALAVIPILFVWVYLSWIVVLLGAEFTCSLEEVWEPAVDEEEKKIQAETG